MLQSAFRSDRGTDELPPGLHVGVIMDGNGRWAVARGLPRVSGHREGARAVRRIVEAAPDLGIGVLTLYAFSSDNWGRPRREVRALMALFQQHLASEADELAENGVRLQVVGRRDRLSSRVLAAVRAAEERTRAGERLLLRLAIDYSARDAIVAAAERARDRDGQGDGAALGREAFARLLGEVTHGRGPAPDLDLLVRTGGERRLSDFLLWEAAYAELVFTERMWPDFDGDALAAAVAEYHRRERRFGQVPEQAAG